MDTLKKDSCSLVLFIVLVSGVFLIAKGVSFADTSTASEVLTASYKLGCKIAPAEAESAIADLEKVLINCQDSNLAFRIRYRIGMMYFKAGMSGVAEDQFLRIANELDCPVLIRVCSFNMIGQISRMEGENRQALDAFNQVVELVEQQSAGAKKSFVSAALMRLCCSALLSRAEIRQMQQDYDASISEYDRLLRMLVQNQEDKFSQYIPLAKDRISQLYLKQGNIDKYIEIAQMLPVDCPRYYRAGVIRFEIECIRFLRSVSKDFECADGSFTAPARLITYFKVSKDKDSAKPILEVLSRLCEEHSNTYAGILLSYHYAWLLDAIGEKNKAVEVFARVSSTDIGGVNNNVRPNAIAKTIAEYAKIQCAIMLGEKGDYEKALQVVGSLGSHPEQSHISDLAKSVSEGMVVLRREFPANDNR